MSEMTERVAMALKQAFHEWGRVFDEGQAEDLARAAIEAMREPSEAMKALDASKGTRPVLAPNGQEMWGEFYTPLGSHTGAHWHEMIDEALK